MRIQSLFFLIMINLALTGTLSSQTMIGLFFTANTDTFHQPLDSVRVINWTVGGDTVLHFPDTVLVLDYGTGIADQNMKPNDDLILYESYPNPFTGQATTSFNLPEHEFVMVQVFDLTGRCVAAFQQTLPAGKHTFTLHTGSSRYYILAVETARQRRTQKLVSLAGYSGNCKLEYTGYHPAPYSFKRERSGFSWTSGDYLLFTGYTQLPGNITVGNLIMDEPSQSTVYVFRFSKDTYRPGTVHCDPLNPSAIVEVYNPFTGKIWMDRNLGASQAANSPTDAAAYGDLYQWGRFSDGHQYHYSPTTNTLSTTDNPGHGNFICSNALPFDWRSPPNPNLWQGVAGINNPCPIGYRIPTEAEFRAESYSWVSNNRDGAFDSPLKLPVAGYRTVNYGSFSNPGYTGFYWSSTVEGNTSYMLGISNSNAVLNPYYHGYGGSVRCIRDSIVHPAQPSPILGSGNPCNNSTGIIYSTNDEPGINYFWSVPAGWTITSGQYSNEIITTVGNSSGTIEVSPTNINSIGFSRSLPVAPWACVTGSFFPGYVHCSPANHTSVVDVYNPITGKTWMDRNLGASQVATSSTDTAAYGDLFQWGRLADGHQCRSSDSTIAVTVLFHLNAFSGIPSPESFSLLK
jgi:uncharacterized protein (TIGR02145 family)